MIRTLTLLQLITLVSCIPEFPVDKLEMLEGNPDGDFDQDGQTENEGDCDDTRSDVFTGADELCDNVDNDCNGTIDDNPIDSAEWYLDQDGDGFGLQSTQIYSCSQPARHVLKRIHNSGEALFDCDDSNIAIFPGNTEVCDAVDNNCDGLIDENVALTFIQDADNDGFGNPLNSTMGCSIPPNYILLTADIEENEQYDCNDDNAEQYPDAPEVCDEVDNNCDGLIDEGVLLDLYLDNDEDGFGSAANRIERCSSTPGYVNNADDCNDDNAEQYPDAPEVCNLEDDDCDNQSDEGENQDAPINAPTWYLDFDGDGVGTDSVSIISCYAPSNYVAAVGDCLDDNSNIYPGAPEICDNIDQDCDGVIDNNPVGGVTFYADTDNDGDGDLYTSDIIQACYQYDPTSQQYLPPVGYSSIQGDCNDGNAAISSLEPELCTPIDENCDGSNTSGAIDQVEWFVDSDGDGFGNIAFSIISCPTIDPQTNLETAPLGYSSNSDDCNDLDGTLFPGNTEICNGKLDDCNAAEDGNGDGVVEYTARSIELDHDGDGFIECFFNVNEWVTLNTLPLGPIIGSNASVDCQPFDDDVFPGAPELCTGEVEDCDSPDYGTVPTDESDDDGDGYVECAGFIGVGWEGDPNVIGGNDCDDRSTDDNNDGDPDGLYTYPGAAENYPDPLNPDLNFCVADQDEDGLPDCARMTTNLQQELPNGYFCEYGIFLETTTLGAIGPDFVYIPAGQDPDNRYILTQSFYMMTTEVTREMYESLTGDQPSAYHSNTEVDYPVENIEWIDAAYFANLLSEESGLESCYNENNNFAPFNQYSGSNFYLCPGYRLPTEAEWEYAARGGVSLPPQYLGAGVWTPDGGGYIEGYGVNSYINDNGNMPSLSSYAWWWGNNSPNTPKQVSRLAANYYGLYDLHGNVQEMMNDWSTSSSPGNFAGHVFPNNGTLSNGMLVDPVGPGSGNIKVLRGGHFNTYDHYKLSFDDLSSIGLASGQTSWATTYSDTGFRLVRTAM